MSFILHPPAILEANVSLNGENIDLFLNEDTDGDGTPENVEKIDLQNGSNKYQLTKIEPDKSNDYWVELYFLNSDITSSPVTKSVKLKGRNWNQEHDWNYSQKKTAVNHENIANTDHANDTNVRHGNPYASINSGLIAYYPMERNQSTHLHDAALKNPGDINGATWTTGKVGNYALSFDGTDDNIDTTISEFPESFTISAWAQFGDGGSSNEFIASNHNSSSSDVVFGVQNNDEFVFNVDKSGNLNPSTPSVSSGTWYHVVGVADSSSGTILYVDGSEAGSNSASWSGAHNTGANIHLGMYPDGTGPLNGPLDDVRIYDRVLSPTEVKTLYNLTKNSGKKKTSTPSPGPVAYYKLDGNAKDSAGSNDGTVNGATETSNAIRGTALSFDGTDDYVSTPTRYLEPANTFSLSLWINIQTLASTAGSNQMFFGKKDTDGTVNDTVQLWQDSSDDDLNFDVFDSDENPTTTRGGKVLKKNRWYHITCIYDASASEKKVYVDSNLDMQGSAALNSRGIAYDLYIGARNNAGSPDLYANALIDQVRIYDRALTPLKVEKLYHYGSYRISRKQVLNR